MNKRLKTSIVGAAGYVGGELIRLLSQHPHVAEIIPVSQSQSGKKIREVHDACWDMNLVFVADLPRDADVIFLCNGHGKSAEFLKSNQVSDEVLVVDMSRDFRLDNDFGFVYGLPEWNRKLLAGKKRIANPGCFATAIQLGVLPLKQIKNIPDFIAINAVTGSTGAGFQPGDSTHFSYRHNNLSNYKTFSHEHNEEINRTLTTDGFVLKQPISFVPVRGSFTRGIFTTIQFLSDENIYDLAGKFYEDEYFIQLQNKSAELKSVINTNHVLIGIEQKGNLVCITVAIDNLLKGAAGQAVQNMNAVFGYKETEGLQLKGMIY